MRQRNQQALRSCVFAMTWLGTMGVGMTKREWQIARHAERHLRRLQTTSSAMDDPGISRYMFGGVFCCAGCNQAMWNAGLRASIEDMKRRGLKYVRLINIGE